MASYPIWVNIESCNYKTNKSYGIKRHNTQEIQVGTSPSNSHKFASITLKHSEKDGTHTYYLQVDGKTVKKAILPKGADEITIEDLINV